MMPPRFELFKGPTPCHRLDRASESLGVDLWIKRDDLTGFALGGNKVRKIEYLIADALANGASCVVTCGSIQSNFVRQLAVACRMAGLRFVCAVMNLPYDSGAGKPLIEPPHLGGNLVINQLAGAELRLFPDDDWEILYAHSASISLELESEGETVYEIPIGGSTALGAYAFIQAATELTEEFDAIIFASSSGSTHTGLQIAFAKTKTKVIGIACDPEPEMAHDFVGLSEEVHAIWPEYPKLKFKDFNLDFRFVGPGYGVESESGKQATDWLLKKEGILLDPVYTAKAFAGCMQLCTENLNFKRVLFWHTGGLPALFTF